MSEHRDPSRTARARRSRSSPGGSASTRSSSPSARAPWAWSTSPTTPCSTATWRSRSWSPQIADDPELKQRFEREAKAVAKMTHPNVVTVFDLGSHTDGSPYIAMELLKGQDLQKAMRAAADDPRAQGRHHRAGPGRASPTRTRPGSSTATSSPPTSSSTHDGSVKIMDFGVARADHRLHDRHRQHRRHGRLHVARAGEGRARSTGAATSSASAACSSSC